MKVTICDVCKERRVQPLEITGKNALGDDFEMQLSTGGRLIGAKSMNLDLCWQCFDELRANE